MLAWTATWLISFIITVAALNESIGFRISATGEQYLIIYLSTFTLVIITLDSESSETELRNQPYKIYLIVVNTMQL